MRLGRLLGATGALLSVVALGACNADRSGTIVSTKPAASVKIDNCSPIAGATTVSWSNFATSVASVQVAYTAGTATSTSGWTNASTAATSGSVKVSGPTSVTGGTWVVSSVTTATSKNGGGTKTTVNISCSATSSGSSATPVTAAPRGA